MDPRRPGSKGGKTPSFVRPFLYALNQMQASEVLRPSQYMDRARSILMDRLGAAGGQPVTAFCQGVVGVMADHTHYYDGFALLLRLSQGLSVSMRPHAGATSRVVIEGVPEVLSFDASDQDRKGFRGLLACLLTESHLQHGEQVDISIVGAIPTGLGAAFHAACAVGVLQARDQMTSSDSDAEASDSGSNDSGLDRELLDHAVAALSRWYGRPFSPAFVIGCLAKETEGMLLIDTATKEYLPVPVDKATRPGWAIVEFDREWAPTMDASVSRFKLASNVLSDLQKGAFSHLDSLRGLEHRDLEAALGQVARKHRKALKYLVSEDRNVQKMVVALRKADWQFFGALMMISQASKAIDWNVTNALHQAVLDQAESASLDGIFGAVQTGESGCMLVAGQPFSLPAFLDETVENLSGRTNVEVQSFIL